MSLTQARYDAMTVSQLIAERDTLLVRVDRWLTEGYRGMARIAASKLDRVEETIERKREATE